MASKFNFFLLVDHLQQEQEMKLSSRRKYLLLEDIIWKILEGPSGLHAIYASLQTTVTQHHMCGQYMLPSPLAVQFKCSFNTLFSKSHECAATVLWRWGYLFKLIEVVFPIYTHSTIHTRRGPWLPISHNPLGGRLSAINNNSTNIYMHHNIYNFNRNELL